MEKDLPDSLILDTVIKSLNMAPAAFASKLGYNSHVTIYNVLKGKNDMTNDMINRIKLNLPTVSPLYITRGKGEPILQGSAVRNVANLVDRPISHEETVREASSVSVKDFLSLPERLDYIEQQNTLIINNQEEIKKLLKKLLDK